MTPMPAFPRCVAVLLLLALPGCLGVGEPLSAKAVRLQELARQPVATGRAEADQERLRQLAGRLAAVIGEQAGFYHRCTEASPQVYQQTLVTVLSDDPPPPRAMNLLGTDYRRGFQDGAALPCGDHGVAEELQERRQEAETAYGFFRCTMPWHHGGTWTPNGDGALRSHGVTYREFIARCGIG